MTQPVWLPGAGSAGKRLAGERTIETSLLPAEKVSRGGCLRLQQALRLSRCSYPDSGVRNNMSSSDAIVLVGEGRRRPSPFSLGLTETAAIGAVKSTVVIRNDAAQPETPTKLPAARMNAE